MIYIIHVNSTFHEKESTEKKGKRKVVSYIKKNGPNYVAHHGKASPPKHRIVAKFCQ